MLIFGCGCSGHLKCPFSACNTIIKSFLSDCPISNDEIDKYLQNDWSDVFSGWYDDEHGIAIAKTREFTHLWVPKMNNNRMNNDKVFFMKDSHNDNTAMMQMNA